MTDVTMKFSLDAFLQEAAQVLEVPPETLNENSDNSSVPSWDSLRSLMLAMMVEERFGVALSGEEMQSFVSVKRIAEIMSRHAAI